jgi:hypothetical protein
LHDFVAISPNNFLLRYQKAIKTCHGHIKMYHVAEKRKCLNLVQFTCLLGIWHI